MYTFELLSPYATVSRVAAHLAAFLPTNFGICNASKRSDQAILTSKLSSSTEDYSWVKELRVPGMAVIPYIADNTSAPHHAQRNKGHEAMMYHQYFFDFYDDLPDISILIHSQQLSWHVDGLLEQSMIFSLNHLDLAEVKRRQFLNLRVTWGIGCSTGSINTTRVNEESGSAPEQKEMQEVSKFICPCCSLLKLFCIRNESSRLDLRVVELQSILHFQADPIQAFRANFNVYDVPEILATPCCSQIAVTKERIRSIPREQYQHHIDWILNTNLPDSISGRTWGKAYFYTNSPSFSIGAEKFFPYFSANLVAEHMWQHLFLQKAIDCPVEHIAYCRLYHICFSGRVAYEEWIELNQGRQTLEKELKDLAAADEKEVESKEDAERHKKVESEDGENVHEKEKGKDEIKKKAKAKTKKWLEEELASIREAIRLRREIAVVRGAIEANRIAEGTALYGDEIEPGVESIIFKPDATS
jgi:hypothetical protein